MLSLSLFSNNDFFLKYNAMVLDAVWGVSLCNLHRQQPDEPRGGMKAVWYNTAQQPGLAQTLDSNPMWFILGILKQSTVW